MFNQSQIMFVDDLDNKQLMTFIMQSLTFKLSFFMCSTFCI